MKRLKIKPTTLRGHITVPPSKSLSHRAIIGAALADGISEITNIVYSQDIIATLDAMEAIGTTITRHSNALLIDGSTTFHKADRFIDCRESGSTLRFLLPITLVTNSHSHFIGQGNLGKRPLDPYYTIFDEQSIMYRANKDTLDLHVTGKLSPGHFSLPGNISSQFISGLLFALPLLAGDSTILLTTAVESKGYIDLTLHMLDYYGICITHDDAYTHFMIPGNQKYKPHDYQVEADASQAAYFAVAGALGNPIVMTNINMDTKQGDQQIFTFLKRMQASIIEKPDGIQVEASQLQGCTIDARPCPDIIPIISLACSVAGSPSHIMHASRLRIKECDRLEAIVQQLGKLGAHIQSDHSSIRIHPASHLSGGICQTYSDHRIAMLLAIAASIAQDEIILDDYQCVTKSYPDFWRDYQMLGGIIDEFDMEK